MTRMLRREMVERRHPGLSTVRQCTLLGISRSSLHYQPGSPFSEDQVLMKLMDQ